MERLDIWLFEAVNGLAGVSALRDGIMRFVSGSDVLKGLPVMMLWWGLWFKFRDDQREARARLITVLACAIGAIVVGRGLAAVLPFRLRPMHDPAVDSILPIGAWERTLGGWNSMPSDHAVLFFALAVGMVFVHRAVGYLLVAHAVIVIGLPRIFMGFHFPSDIVVGALLGLLIAALMMRPFSAAVQRSRFFHVEREAPHLVYPLLFFVTFQTATLFDSARDFAASAWRALQLIVS